MRRLAIETATAACSVALIEDNVVIASNHAVVGRGHAERLLPMIAALPEGGRCDAVLVDIGPGSFTGIRVGIAAARALAFAWGIAATGYHSLALIAAIDGFREGTVIAIEGGHGEVFLGNYCSAFGAVIDRPGSLPFDDAVSTLSAQRIVGNAAERLVAARGFGEAVAVMPDARQVGLLPARFASWSPVPLYGRGADAKPLVVA